MHLTLNLFALILAVSGVATIIMALIIYGRLRFAERSFALVIGLAGWWALTYSGELFSTTLPMMLFWLKLEYVGIVLLPLALLYFIRVFISKRTLDIKLSNLWIFILPAITVLLIYTNENHHFYYKSIEVDRSGAFPVLAIKPSFWYYIFTIYFYITLAWSIYSLITSFKSADSIYKKQKNTILSALIVPWFFNILYKFGIGFNENIDLTPFAFIVTSLIISFSLLRYKLMDIIPVAREKIFESMQDAVLVLNAVGKVIDKNRQMHEVLPLFTQKIVGCDLTQLFPSVEELLQGVADRKKNTLEIKLEEQDSKNYFEVDINVLPGRDGEYTGCILIFKNITQRKKDAIALVALNKLKDKLFSIIAHDLRSPLINIMDMIRLIDEQEISEEEFKLFLPELSKNLSYTSGLLDNLLHWSKSQLKGEIVDAAMLDIKEMVLHEIDYYQQKAIEKGIHLASAIENETWVFADIEMIRLVIRNLIANAIKYCSKEDHIIVSSVLNSSNDVTICVMDTGCGMKPETFKKLFLLETFTTKGTNNEQGTGLGLRLCKDFVEKNNGKIWVTTELGIGSKFYFTVPKASYESVRS